MAAHAKYSPSSAPRLVRCLGSNFLESKCPDRDSDDAADGTASHELAAWCFTHERAAREYLGHEIKVGERTFVVDEERADYVQRYLDDCKAVVDNYLNLGATSIEARVEQKVNISQSIGLDDQFGTADHMLIVYWPDHSITLDVTDLKYGRGVQVDAEENEQLMLYALGAMDEVDLLGEIREVVIRVHQPRIEHMSEWRTTAQRLRDFAELFAHVVDVSEAIHAAGAVDLAKHLTPGEKQCKFCRAKATCPALAAKVQAEIGAEFEDLTAVFGEKGQDTADMIGSNDNDHLASAMSSVDLIESWCTAVRAETERRLLAGTAVPGFKLVEGRRGARKWVNEQEAEAALKSMRLKRDQMYEYSLISPTTAEKLHKGDVIGKRQWPRLQQLIKQSEGNPSVAPDSDKRPAINVAGDFEVITD